MTSCGKVRLLVAAEVLARLLVEYDGDGPLVPGTEGLDVQVLYSDELADAVRADLESAGASFADVADALLLLYRAGARAEPASEKLVFDDPGRDMLVRLAVGAGADYVVSGDPDLVDLGTWRGIKFLPDLASATREILAKIPTVPVFRASTELEAQVACEVLEEAGIRYFEASRQIPWYDGIMTLGEGFYGEIHVLEKDRARAEELLGESMDRYLGEEE